MEALLHYVWLHRLYPIGPLHTADGKTLEVIDPGLYNRDAGPDFFNAKIRIDGQLWVGNIEIHLRASDWYRHHHDTDAHYNNVVLHVVQTLDREVTTANGLTLPQFVMQVPAEVRAPYDELMAATHYPPCRRIIPSIPELYVHGWLDALSIERLSHKAERIRQWLSATAGDWERTFFITLARAFGFGKNSDAFEAWAATIDPQQIGKHRDNPLQVEAYFFGQAGLLNDEATAPERRDTHFLELQREYRFLQKKFSLTPLPHHRWQFLRMRPANFPHRRLAQLAELYATRRLDFASMKQMRDVKTIAKLLTFNMLPYWSEHYTFGVRAEGKENSAPPAPQKLSAASVQLLVINAIAPTLFAYAQQHSDETMQAQAFELLHTLRAERNAIIDAWRDSGIEAQHAADSQALLHLKLHYCDTRKCLDCRFGSCYLRQRQKP
ncbi:MAG: DUF2851 family protein [Bacteroidaceae bacterium]|nr:DUF2851 family protein [Bacteroidaceae bacterium]